MIIVRNKVILKFQYLHSDYLKEFQTHVVN